MEIVETPFFAMGSPCWILIAGNAGLDKATETAIAEARRIESRFSRYDPDSLLNRLNRVASEGGSAIVDDETAFLIDRAFEAHEFSEGLFDVTSGLLRRVWRDDLAHVPTDAEIAPLLELIGLAKLRWRRPEIQFPTPGMELDFGGLAKEYAADRAARALSSLGIRHGFVNLGGDIAVLGPHPNGSPWRIGVTDPFGGAEAVATLFVAEGGVATSGDYERFFSLEGRRYSHVFDPVTGRPVETLPSVTVVAETCLTAGLLATSALLRGRDAPGWLRTRGAAYLCVTAPGRLAGSIIGKEGAVAP